MASGPLVRLNGSRDREGKVKKSGPDRSNFGKKCKIRSISDLDIGRQVSINLRLRFFPYPLCFPRKQLIGAKSEHISNLLRYRSLTPIIGATKGSEWHTFSQSCWGLTVPLSLFDQFKKANLGCMPHFLSVVKLLCGQTFYIQFFSVYIGDENDKPLILKLGLNPQD